MCILEMFSQRFEKYGFIKCSKTTFSDSVVLPAMLYLLYELFGRSLTQSLQVILLVDEAARMIQTCQDSTAKILDIVVARDPQDMVTSGTIIEMVRLTCVAADKTNSIGHKK